MGVGSTAGQAGRALPQAAANVGDEVDRLSGVDVDAAIGHELVLRGVVELGGGEAAAGRPPGRVAGSAVAAEPPSGAGAAAPRQAGPEPAMARRLSAYPLRQSRYG